MPKTQAIRGVSDDTPSVTPLFPLILLETLRDMDRPEELLEGEDLTASMPRRLGLSDVVYLQIHRFREEVKRKRLQTPAVVEDLLRLVIRRHDADEIFLEAGRRLANRLWEERSATARRAVRLLPPALRARSAARAARRLLRQLQGTAWLETGGKPFAVRMVSSMTYRADPGGAACAFYAGALAELLREYTGKDHTVAHPRCQATGAEACEWTVVEHADRAAEAA
ncbi:MAG TPA: V4R domain-containing protein [Longimicrobium sp.]|jgi:predicted hydrocarbon binding protein